MKTKIASIAAGIALTVASASAFAINGTVGEGQVNFHGKVNGASCMITVNGDFKNGRVILDDVELHELKKNALVKTQPVNIEISDCTGVALNNLSVNWTDGIIATGDNAGYLDNELEDEAKGVYMGLSTTNDISGLVNIGAAGSDGAVENIIGDTKVVYYNVGYVLGNDINSGNDVHAGRISTHATYQVDYQ